jgi:hypothetical protein
MGMMLLDAGLYFCLAWYLEQVLAIGLGQGLPWWFVLSRSWWASGQIPASYRAPSWRGQLNKLPVCWSSPSKGLQKLGSDCNLAGLVDSHTALGQATGHAPNIASSWGVCLPRQPVTSDGGSATGPCDGSSLAADQEQWEAGHAGQQAAVEMDGLRYKYGNGVCGLRDLSLKVGQACCLHACTAQSRA